MFGICQSFGVHPFYEQCQTTVLGRLKMKALSELSGSLDRVPTHREFFAEVFRRWKQNSEAGRFYFYLLDCHEIDRVEFSAKFSAKQVRSILSDLNRTESFNRIFAEGRLHGQPGTPLCGCLVLGHTRPTGEPGYYAMTYWDEEMHRVSFCSLVPDGCEGVGRLSVFQGKDGWQDVTPESAGHHAGLRVMLATFQRRLAHVGIVHLPAANLRVNPALEPPEDSEYMRRVEAIADKRLQITKAVTQRELIRPHSLGNR